MLDAFNGIRELTLISCGQGCLLAIMLPMTGEMNPIGKACLYIHGHIRLLSGGQGRGWKQEGVYQWGGGRRLSLHQEG